MRKAIVIGILLGIAALFGLAALATACSPKPDLVEQYAQCMANPSSPIHEPAGKPTKAQAEAILRAELTKGETTMDEIKGALVLFCHDV